ncbi:MAG TPA: GspMb/PilO family protein [Blastocatellia bacterium]|nr:GspMb/PilO family protein [Blastocatellia bacterium]
MNLKIAMRETFSRLRDAIGRARLSRVEIVFLGAAILFASAVALFYSYKVAPLGFALTARHRQIQDMKAQIEVDNTNEKKRLDQASNAEKILKSLRNFDSSLTPDERGMTQIINEIDALSVTHKIVANDSTYRPEEADEPKLDQNGNRKPQPNRDKRPKIYPNLGVETTVVGDYPNLRRFLSDLERSKQFLIINSLSFQGGDERIARQLTKGGKQIQLSSPEAVPVSLKIELDTYFQPPSVGVATAQYTPVAPKNPR